METSFKCLIEVFKCSFINSNAKVCINSWAMFECHWPLDNYFVFYRLMTIEMNVRNLSFSANSINGRHSSENEWDASLGVSGERVNVRRVLGKCIIKHAE